MDGHSFTKLAGKEERHLRIHSGELSFLMQRGQRTQSIWHLPYSRLKLEKMAL